MYYKKNKTYYWNLKPKDKDQSKYEYNDSRRPRLTLTHLNKLKKMRKLKKLDLDKRYKFFKEIYGIPPAPPPTM